MTFAFQIQGVIKALNTHYHRRFTAGPHPLSVHRVKVTFKGISLILLLCDLH